MTAPAVVVAGPVLDHGKPTLRVRGLVVERGATPILHDVSFVAPVGHVTALLGPNGAGKTTLLNTIAGVLQPTAGSIEVRGAGGRVGYSPQGVALYPNLTARENLTTFASYAGVPRRERSAAIAQSLAVAQLEDRADDRVKNFSGGMKQRLNIAVAMLGAPALLLLDEPTVGVDPQSRAHLLDTVTQLVQNTSCAVVYSTHYMEEVEQIATDVVIIDHGRVVAVGEVHAIRRMNDAAVGFARQGAADDVLALLAARYAVTVLPGGERCRVTAHRSATGPGDGQDDGDVTSVIVAVVEAFRAFADVPRGLGIDEANLERAFLSLTGNTLRD